MKQKAATATEAWDAVQQAKVTLRRAQAGGDTARETAAKAALEKATANFERVRMERFEQLAADNGGTVVRRLEELAKLVRLERYKPTEAHKAAILNPIKDALDELEAAFVERLRARQGKKTRTIAFDHAEAE